MKYSIRTPLPKWAPQVGGTYESFEGVSVQSGCIILVEPNYKRNFIFFLSDVEEVKPEMDFKVEEDETAIADDLPLK